MKIKRQLVRIALLTLCLALLLGLALIPGCGMLGDPLDDLYTQNIYPGTHATYDIGSLGNQYQNGYFANLFIGGVPVGPGGGDVIGPAGATANALVRYDGVTGKLIKDSLGTTLDNFANLTLGGDLFASDVNAGNDVNVTNDLDVTDDADVGGDLVVVGDITGANIITAGQVDGVDVANHGARHENGGADEISVAALSGLLADDQHVLDAEVLAVAAALVHAVRHQNGGADEISVTGLSGLLADDQHVLDAEVLAVAAALVHAARHAVSGADTVFPADPDADEYLMWDDVPGVLVWSAIAGGGDVAGPAASTDNMIARHHGAGGKTLQDYVSNPPTISDTGDMNIDGDLDVENIVASGTVDGRDVSADGTKLDNVVANTQAITHSILDDKTATIDGTVNQPVDGDYAKWTADGLEGRSLAELQTELGLDPAITFVISPSGGDYTTIQAALTANVVVDALFLVYPDTYVNDTINFTANGQVVVGMGSRRQVILTNAAQIVNYGAHTNCRIISLKLNGTYAADIDMVTGTGSCTFKQVSFDADIAGAIAGRVPTIAGTGTTVFRDCTFYYDNDAASAGQYKCVIELGAGADVTVERCRATVDGSGAAGGLLFAFGDSTGVICIERCTIDVTDADATYAVCAGIFVGSGESEFYYNNIHCTATAGTAVGLYLDAHAAIDLFFRSMFNHIACVGGTNAYSFWTANDGRVYLVSQFDDLVAADGINKGANSNVIHLHSEADGDFDMSGDLLVGGDVTTANVVTAGNVDGRDVSVDGAKLDGIDAGADVTGDNAPQAHKASHESGGADEINDVDINAGTMGGVTLDGTITINGQYFDAGAGGASIYTTGAQQGLILAGSSAAQGPHLRFYHNHTTPNLNTVVGEWDVLAYDGAVVPAQLRYGMFRVLASNVTDGAEEGTFYIYMAAGGTGDNLAMRLTGPGVLDVDASSGLGAATVGQFDIYDDTELLREAISYENLVALEEVGVMQRKDTGSGWMMNVQGMMYLISGATYQNRDKIDVLNEQVAILEAEVEALKNAEKSEATMNYAVTAGIAVAVMMLFIVGQFGIKTIIRRRNRC